MQRLAIIRLVLFLAIGRAVATMETTFSFCVWKIEPHNGILKAMCEVSEVQNALSIGQACICTPTWQFHIDWLSIMTIINCFQLVTTPLQQFTANTLLMNKSNKRKIIAC